MSQNYREEMKDKRCGMRDERYNRNPGDWKCYSSGRKRLSARYLGEEDGSSAWRVGMECHVG